MRFSGCNSRLGSLPARRRRATIYTGATPELFAKHLKEAVKIVSERKSDEHKIIFLRSWNEWAEGNYVEPDLKYGHGFLEAIKRISLMITTLWTNKNDSI